jgi:general stress protein 26
MGTQTVTDLATVADEVERRIRSTVWCTLATTDHRGRPRTRIVHPVWERADDALVGWLGTRTGTPKLAHLAATPWASLLYWDPRHQQVTIDAAASVHTDDPTRERVWASMASLPEPYGFDPAPMWPDGATGPGFTVVRFDPVRIALFGQPQQVWRRPVHGS